MEASAEAETAGGKAFEKSWGRERWTQYSTIGLGPAINWLGRRPTDRAIKERAMGRMARPAMWVAIGIFLACSSARASDQRDAAAVTAAQTWLALVDAGRYEESWRTAAAYFKNAIGQDQWNKSLGAVRRPLGKV